MARTQRVRFSDQLRAALQEHGECRAEISRKTGIDEATLCRFVSGERGLPMKTLDRLADYLDLNVTVGRGKGKAKRG